MTIPDTRCGMFRVTHATIVSMEEHKAALLLEGTFTDSITRSTVKQQVKTSIFIGINIPLEYRVAMDSNTVKFLEERGYTFAFR